MKRILALAAIAIFIQACTLETDPNGQLGGFWQMTGITSIESGTGGTETTYTPTKQDLLFWAVQGDILCLQKKNLNKIMYHFKQRGDSLIVYEPRDYNRVTGDTLITEVKHVEPFGMTALTDTFHIDRLDNSAMTLSTSKRTLHFRRY